MTDRPDGRLATVAGAVIPGWALESGAGRTAPEDGRAAAQIVRLLASLFEEVVWVGGDPPAEVAGRRAAAVDGPPGLLRDIGSALAAAAAERVLVVAADGADVSPDLLLALVAWPEADAVAPRPTGSGLPPCVLYRREPALRAARAQLAAGRDDPRDLFEALDTAYVGADALPGVDPPGA